MDKRNKLKESLGGFLTLLCDLMLLNILWLVCSLPIITVGPSTCALFACMLKISRDELGESTTRTFFRAFKDNFRNAFFYGLIGLAALFVLYVDISFAVAQEGIMRKVLLVSSGTAGAVVLIYLSFVFALQARYENSFKGQIKNAFLLAFCSPLKTLLMWIVYAIPVSLIIFLPFELVLRLGFLFLMFGISLPVYFNCKTLRNIFDKFVKETDTNGQTESESAG